MEVGAGGVMAWRVLQATPGTVTWEVTDVFIWCEVRYSFEGNNSILIKQTPQAGLLACLLPNRGGGLINGTLLSALHKRWIHSLCGSRSLFPALPLLFNPFFLCAAYFR